MVPVTKVIFLKKVMQKFWIYGNLILSHFKSLRFWVFVANFILTEVFENGSFNLHNYMDLTHKRGRGGQVLILEF